MDKNIKKNKHTKIISLQIHIDLYEKLRKFAFDKHVSISKLVRDILEKSIV